HLSPPSFFSYATPPPYLATLSLHDALPISRRSGSTTTGPTPCWSEMIIAVVRARSRSDAKMASTAPIERLACIAWCRPRRCTPRSEEHTSELQSRENLVCRLLLAKNKHQIK